jgi:acid phosphatase type 7
MVLFYFLHFFLNQNTKMKKVLFTICVLYFLCTVNAQTNNNFLVTPYLQVGENPSPTTMSVLWHVTDDADWSIEVKLPNSKNWVAATPPTSTTVSVAGINKFMVYKAQLTNLTAGTAFEYRLSKNKKVVFTNTGKALKSAEQPYRLLAFGDIGAGTKEAKQIANGVYKANADIIAVTGDIVYEYGLISEYTKVFWPIYNTDKADTVGVPLMHSIPFIAAVGNHDMDTRDLDKRPDALAYYHFWDQPLNGPIGVEGGAIVPALKGSDANIKAFKDAAGNRYPRMSNYSFNYGNAHILMLDADTYVDWTDSVLKAWVAKDLEDAKNAAWRFVFYHHPGFNSSVEHFEQQQMRLLAPIFEKGKVDVVFNGHVHNYQRSFPMQFAPLKNGALIVGGKENKTVRGRVVPGLWTLDKTFDGKTNTKPNGVVYVITGAGGQKLYNPEQNDKPNSWQKFTDKFVSNIHSFTVVDVNGKTLQLKQIDVNGKEIDVINITK